MRESSSLLSHDATCMLVMEDPTKRVGQIVAGVKMLATLVLTWLEIEPVTCKYSSTSSMVVDRVLSWA